MRSIAELTGRKLRKPLAKAQEPWPLPNNLMGIELEVDNTPGICHDLNNLNFSSWTTHQDGSLQNGTEFVLRTPLFGDALASAVAEIMQYGPFNKTITGSTHIHMDMIDVEDSPTSHETLRILLLLVYSLEDVLYAAGDNGRRFCGFCNTLSSAPDNLISVALDPDIGAGAFLSMYRRQSSSNSRYYGLNMLALGDYGSLEFRYFPTASTKEELTKYIRLVQTFKKAALSLSTVEDLIDVFSSADKFYAFIEAQFSEFIELFRSNISYVRAVQSIEKARSIAMLPKTTRRSTYDFTKILKSNKFKKVIGENNSPCEIHVVNRLGTIPEARGKRDILLYVDRAYLSNGVNWVDVDGWNLEMAPTSSQLALLPTLLERTEIGELPTISDRSRRAIVAIINVANTTQDFNGGDYDSVYLDDDEEGDE